MAGTPLKLYNTSDLREMSDAEIDACIVPLVLYKFATVQTTSLRANLNLAGGYSGDYTFTDTVRDDDVGAHPTDSAITTTYYKFSQDTSTEGLGSTVYPFRYIASGNKLQTLTSAEMKDHILLRQANAWAGTLYPIGGYHLGTAAPDSHTWSTIGSTATDNYRASGTDGAVQYNLRRITGVTGANQALNGLMYGTFSAANPTNIAHNSHGLETGDYIAVVQASATVSANAYTPSVAAS